tara:strand:+ start:49 stop:219 length:171 start_codon:yes stop_codon:yes gene_type:complete
MTEVDRQVEYSVFREGDFVDTNREGIDANRREEPDTFERLNNAADKRDSCMNISSM